MKFSFVYSLLAASVAMTGVVSAQKLVDNAQYARDQKHDMTRSAAAILTSGVPVNFTLPAVATSTLLTGDFSFRIAAPTGATRLEIKLTTATPGVDVDLFVRFG